MKERFSYINFVKNYDEIKVKPDFLLKILPKYLDYYVKKNNPLQIVEKNIMEIKGFETKIPITKEEAKINEKKFKYIMEKTIQQLHENEINIIIMPKNFTIKLSEKINISDGNYIFPFFILEIINNLFKNIDKNLENTEIVIFDGNEYLTKIIIEILCPHVKFLNVVTETVTEYYKNKMETIFQETGFDFSVIEHNKSFLKNIDVIINTSSLHNYHYTYKKGAVYIELGQDLSVYKELLIKRSDMITINSYDIISYYNTYQLTEIEIFMYIKCRSFRLTVIKGFNPNFTSEILRFIKSYNFKVKNLIQNEKVLNSVDFNKFITVPNVDNN